MSNRRIGRTARLSAAMLLATALQAGSLLAQQQPIDQEYTSLIKKATTETFFLTPLVDYLPASNTVPSPLKHFGTIAGQPDVLHYPEEINAYMRAVDAASDRVKVFSIGQSEEGREMIVVAVSDEQTIANLENYKPLLGQLADPRKTSPEQAAQIIPRAKPIYWATGAMHSPETGSPEMVMELVYRLAVDEGEHIRTIRNNMIVMVTPVQEVDGRAKVVDIHMAPRKDPNGNYPRSPLFWGKYVAHDNNRDNMGLSLKLTQNMVKWFLEYNPTIVHDLHESASYLYTSTGRGPYNAWIDPILVSEWNRLAHKEVKDMTAWGVPGVYTHDFYDGWAPNYMFWVANMRNSIGRFYETQGSGNASTRPLQLNVDRQWHRMNTPLRQVMWNIRNNVNLQQSAILIAMREVAENKNEFLNNFYLKSQRSIAKARTEGPAAYVFPASDPRLGQQALLLDVMQRQGMEVHRTTAAATIGDRSFPTGSYVIRMDQPFSRTADMLLDKQYYNPNDPSPYDDTGWTLGALFDAQTVRIEDVKILDAPMQLVNAPIKAPGSVENAQNARAFLINYTADNQFTTFRYQHRNLRINAARDAFDAGGKRYNAGSFIIPVQGNTNVAQTLEQAAREFGLRIVGVSDVPSVATHPVAAPRVAVMHTWQTTQNEGWLRLGLDQFGVPYDYISVHDARDNPRLKDKYDVIIFGPSSSDPLSILAGVQGAQPMPRKKTPVTPNLGRQTSTDDMRGGLELQGVLNLQRFVEQGGTFITLTNSSTLPVHFGMAPGVRVAEPENLWAPGGVFRTQLTERTSPLAYGYGDELGVYFNQRQSPVFAGGGGGGGRGGGAGPGGAAADPGATTARRSGRGDITEQDIVQGRPRDAGQASMAAYREQQQSAQAEGGRGGGPGGPAGAAQAGPRARTVLRFANDPLKLLISGGMTNGRELAGAPALIDVTLGQGHVVLFSFNPFWRSETLGSYGLVFNALLHHGNLDPARGRPTTDQ